jgi:ribosomal protein S21
MPGFSEFKRAAHVRLEARSTGSHLSREERNKEFKKFISLFNKMVGIAGVVYACKEHKHFESGSRKRRRKKHEAEQARLRGKLHENFPAKE